MNATQNEECKVQNRNSLRMCLRMLMVCILYSAFCISAPGCAALGLAANAIPQNQKAKYHGLQGQKVGVIVWADRGIMLDWGPIQLDLANSIETQLNAAKTDETKKMTFPYEPKSYVRYLRDHPGSESMPMTELAPRFGISRLIYVEVREFRTRSAREIELFRGDATASLQVIEVDPSGKSAKVAYSEDNIHAVYPKNSPADGMPNLSDDKVYHGEVEALATELVNRLATHEKDEDRQMDD